MLLAQVGGIHRWQGNSTHERPVTRKMFPFGEVIIIAPDFFIRVTKISCFNHFDYLKKKHIFDMFSYKIEKNEINGIRKTA